MEAVHLVAAEVVPTAVPAVVTVAQVVAAAMASQRWAAAAREAETALAAPWAAPQVADGTGGV